MPLEPFATEMRMAISSAGLEVTDAAPASEKPSVLVIDDEPHLLRALARLLSSTGYRVTTARDGREALEHIRSQTFDVIISDLAMPEMGGLELLRHVRQFDLDVPVILMTGAPSLQSATQAVEYGAFRYLRKPFELGELEAAVRRAVLMHGLARLKRDALEALGAEGMRLSDRAALEVHFERALHLMWVAFQPIMTLSGGSVYGYEVLLRSDEGTLSRPGEILDAAERLGRVRDVGRVVRQRVALAFAELPPDVRVLVNLHAEDLLDDELYDAGGPLGPHAARVILEVTERAPLDAVKDVAQRVARLRQLGFRIALDDLGAGYAGLSTLAQLEPDVLKLDMSLVRGVHTHPVKRRLVQSMARLARALGVDAIAEGVEERAELDTLMELGFDLVQGFYFSPPTRASVVPRLPPARGGGKS
jgi:EAL domain-containing protein (putative c-di-GMP-specific phosphodiesterase class I)